jgi:excisionase family DNA binding protein
MSALTVAQVAERLAVSEKTVYRLVRAGRLPHSRVGRAIRIESADLAALRLEPTATRMEDATAAPMRAVSAPTRRPHSRWRVE